MTTEDHPAADKPAGRAFGRRGLFRAAGASALATAATVFGRPGAAHAYTVACCNLRTSPSSWNTCYYGSDRYIWSCTKSTPYGVCYRYQCCEADWKQTPWGSYYGGVSAWRNVGQC
jgi:hypothetical protein